MAPAITRNNPCWWKWWKSVIFTLVLYIIDVLVWLVSNRFDINLFCMCYVDKIIAKCSGLSTTSFLFLLLRPTLGQSFKERLNDHHFPCMRSEQINEPMNIKLWWLGISRQTRRQNYQSTVLLFLICYKRRNDFKTLLLRVLFNWFLYHLRMKIKTKMIKSEMKDWRWETEIQCIFP